MADPAAAGLSRRQMEVLQAETVLRVVGQEPEGRPAKVVLYVRLNGFGKTELCAQHPTGAEEILSTEP